MIASKSSQNLKKKKLMFLSESREINAYFSSHLASNLNTGLTIILKGLCEVKTQFVNEANGNGNKLKLRYLIIRESTLSHQKKIFIEFYKDDSLSKLKFVIDTDLIEQIDLKEKDLSIYLKRPETREQCLLKYDDRRLLQKWLNTICQSCGFNEIKMRSSANISKSNSNLVNTGGNNLLKSNANTTSSDKSTPKSSTVETKTIAGVAALSVGSFDLCSSTLNSLFRPGVGKENEKTTRDGYLQLDDFVSGADDRPRNSDLGAGRRVMGDNNQMWSSFHSAVNDNKLVFNKDSSLIQGQNIYTNAGAEYMNEQTDEAGAKTRSGTVDKPNDDYYLNKSLRYVPLEVISSLDSSDANRSGEAKSEGADSGLGGVNVSASKRLSHGSLSAKDKRNNESPPNSFYTDWDAVRTNAFKKTLANVNKANV